MTEDIIEELKNKEFKKKFIQGLNKLGFPLEFQIRTRLIEKGYNSVREGVFTVVDNSNQEITKSVDIYANKDKEIKILEDLTLVIGLQLIGDCKFSSDKNRFLLAIPDTSNPQNKMFIGPLLTNFQSANYGVYRNSEIVSQFILKYGEIFIASDIKDTSKDHIVSKSKDKNKKPEDIDKNVPEYERIFNITENTILPPLRQNFLHWQSYAYNDSMELMDFPLNLSKEELVKLLKKHYYYGKLIIPFILTSKPILAPEMDTNGKIVDIKKLPFVLYEHSALKPNDYLEILTGSYDIGVFVCNEQGFDDFIVYIEKLFSILFEEIITNIQKHPFRLIENFNEIKKQKEEIKKIKESKIT